MSELEIRVKSRYQTKAGNMVECLAIQEGKDGKKYALCSYVKISVEGHWSLMKTVDRWSVDGKWLAFPGGIHDIVCEA